LFIGTADEERKDSGKELDDDYQDNKIDKVETQDGIAKNE